MATDKEKKTSTETAPAASAETPAPAEAPAEAPAARTLADLLAAPDTGGETDVVSIGGAQFKVRGVFDGSAISRAMRMMEERGDKLNSIRGYPSARLESREVQLYAFLAEGWASEPKADFEDILVLSRKFGADVIMAGAKVIELSGIGSLEVEKVKNASGEPEGASSASGSDAPSAPANP